MNALYLAGLLVGIAGMLVLDARLRLFLWADPRRAVVVLVVGVGGFLAWDAAGVGLHVFFEGNRALLLGVDLAPQIPLEELLFLVLLCTTTMNAWTFAYRLLGERPSLRGTPEARPAEERPRA